MVRLFLYHRRCIRTFGRPQSYQLLVSILVLVTDQCNRQTFVKQNGFFFRVISVLVASTLSSVLSIPYLIINVIGVSKVLTPHLSGRFLRVRTSKSGPQFLKKRSLLIRIKSTCIWDVVNPECGHWSCEHQSWGPGVSTGLLSDNQRGGGGGFPFPSTLRRRLQCQRLLQRTIAASRAINPGRSLLFSGSKT